MTYTDKIITGRAVTDDAIQ